MLKNQRRGGPAVINMCNYSYAFTGPFALRSSKTLGLNPLRTDATLGSPQIAKAPYTVRTFASASSNRVPAIMRPLVPSPALLEFVPDKAQPRSDILRVLSAYVKEHNLQDPENRRMILCDEKLRDLFGVDQCTILEMSKYITPHLQKPEDVGGKYLEEARLFEEQYIESKKMEPESASEATKRRRRKGSGSTTDDQKLGKRLFKPVILSDELSAICRQKEMPRQQIVKAVWDYIRMNNLQGKPGEPIKCDFLLRKVYNADHIDVKTIMKGIGAHVTKKE